MAPTPAPPSNRARLIPGVLFLILLASFVIRGVYFFLSRNSPFYEPLLLDPRYYHDWALKILHGDVAGGGVFYGLPLYPFFLALCYKLSGVSLVFVKWVQILLGLVTLFFIYKTGEKINSRVVGLLACGLAAVYGPLFFHEQVLIPEALGLPLYAMGFYGVCLFVDDPTPKKGMALGVLLGLAALTKAGILLFVALWVAFLLFSELKSRRGEVIPVLLCVVFFLLTLAPVSAHNFVYGKDKVFLTAHSGFNFYIGNNPDAEGVFLAPEGTGNNVEAQREDSRAIAEKAAGRSLKPSEVSAYWSQKAWAYLMENPGDFLKLYLRKLVLFFDAREISDVQDYVFEANFNPLLHFPWLNFSVLGPLFFLGLASSLYAAKFRVWLYLWLGTYVMGVAAFFINARYRLPLLGVLFPVAALGVVETVRAARQRRWSRLLFYVVVLSLGIWLTQARLVGTNWVRDYLNAGDVYQQTKEYDQAMEWYKRALKIDPVNAKTNLAMGVLWMRLGEYDKAKDYFVKCLDRQPKNAQALNNLGLCYEARGDLATALNYFLKAVSSKPNSAQAHNNLGMVYGKQGENEKAKEEFELSLKLNPSSPRANTNLGLIYYRLGEIEQARALWEKALTLDPDFQEAKKGLQMISGK